MIGPTVLDHLPLWAFFLSTLAVALVAGECGYRVGRRRKSKAVAEKEEAVGPVVGGILGLLGFLLAFTFGFAATRYDTRREVFQAEVNAIETTFLRADLLPKPHRSKVRVLLRDYVEERLEADKGIVSLAEGTRKTRKLQNDMWKQPVDLNRNLGKPDSIDSQILALFVDSLSQMINAHLNRVAAVAHGRVPSEMWGGLFLIALIALFSMGYDVGIRETPRPMVGLGMILCFAVTMALIADLDRPYEGFIRVNHQSMNDLRASMNDVP